jgi:starch phosphorylase
MVQVLGHERSPPSSSASARCTTTAEHDLPRATVLALRQRRGHAARQGLAGHVSAECTLSTPSPNGVHAATWLSQALPAVALTRKSPTGGMTTTTCARSTALTPRRLKPPTGSASSVSSRPSQRTGIELDPRRAHPRLRPPRCHLQARHAALPLDPERLVEIAERIGGLQILYAGKSHPADNAGKALIREVFADAEKLNSPSASRSSTSKTTTGTSASSSPAASMSGLNTPAAPV